MSFWLLEVWRYSSTMRFFSARLNFDNGIVLKLDDFLVNLFQYKTPWHFFRKRARIRWCRVWNSWCRVWKTNYTPMNKWYTGTCAVGCIVCFIFGVQKSVYICMRLFIYAKVVSLSIPFPIRWKQVRKNRQHLVETTKHLVKTTKHLVKTTKHLVETTKHLVETTKGQ